MNSINKTELSILTILYKSHGKLESYNVYKKSRVGFKSFALSVRRLLENELLIEMDNLLCLTEKGKSSVIQGAPKASNNKEWRSVPVKYITPQIGPNEPYIPSISLLDRRTFT